MPSLPSHRRLLLGLAAVFAVVFILLAISPYDRSDWALATCGALLAMAITGMINAYIQHDFTEEWSRSLKTKHREPLGEDEIARLIRQKDRSKR